ncbi:tetratricopeptide repeat protein [Massilia sp. W12]|uniref:ATP-binding protein n=1 Tax=Massilia sp. W12 TaxID=3126507 RepID=UPI0030CE8C64
MTVTAPATEPATLPARLYFADVEVQTAERHVLINGKPALIGPRAFDVLLCLLTRAPHLVSKEDLLASVWPRLVVEENNLQVQVSALRKLFGAQAIATAPGLGYRFTLPLRQHGALSVAPQQALAGNLPHAAAPLIGRANELAELCALLDSARLVTVTGAGGVGKTRLALEAAQRRSGQFPAGVWLVELATLNQDDQVAAVVAATLGIEVKGGGTPTDALILNLRQQPALLLLDNCEHLVDGVARLAGSLLAGTGQLCLLATSQEVLGVEGEQTFRLPSLSLPARNANASAALESDAVQLFVARAHAADAHFQINDRNAALVAAICCRLDGIALALEMAAARVPCLGLESLAQLLDERFQVLTGGRRTALPRQRTLHATLDWSHGLLTPEEAVVFRRIGILIGSFDLAAAVAVAQDPQLSPYAVIDGVASLVSKSLLAADQAGGHVRYRLLESARAYALEKLAAADEVAACAARCATHFRHSFAACFADWGQLTDVEFEEKYIPDIDNLRQSIDWAFGPGQDIETGLALVGSSGQLWASRWLFYEAEQRVKHALTYLDAQTAPLIAGDLWLTACTLFYFHRNEQAVPAAQTAVAALRQSGDVMRLGYALIMLGSCHAVSGSPQATIFLQEAQALLAGGCPLRLESMLHKSFGACYAILGRPEDAIPAFSRALALSEQVGAQFQALTIQEDLADVYWMQGNLDQALHAARDTLQRCRQSRFAYKVSWGWVLGNLFGILVERGDLAEALQIGQEALPYLREFSTMWVVMDHYALRQAKRGMWQAAAHISGWSDQAFARHVTLRQPNERRAYHSTLSLLQQALAAAQLQAWREQGAQMSEEDLCQWALA